MSPGTSRCAAIFWVGVALLGLSTSLLAHVGVAEAFPQNRGTCDYGDDSLTWKFGSGSWSGSEQTIVRDGIEEWLTPVDYNGNTIITSITETGSGDISVRKVAGLGGLGGTDCVGSPYYLDLNADNTDQEMKDVAAHEMAHHLEMFHTGRNDHFGGQFSYLGICDWDLSGDLTNQELSQDDYGHVAHHWDALTGTMTANAGFEHGTLWWWKSSVSDFYSSTSNPKHGNEALRWRPTATDGFVYQTMNFANSAGEEVDAKIWVSKISASTTTGKVTLEIVTQKVDYGTSSSGECVYNQFQPGATVDQNDRNQLFGFVKRRQESITPTTTWQVLSETNAWTVPAGHEAHDVRIRVKSAVKYTDGTFALLAIDSARVKQK